MFTLQLSVTAAAYGAMLELSGVTGMDVPGEEGTTTPVPVNVQWSTAAFSSQATHGRRQPAGHRLAGAHGLRRGRAAEPGLAR